MRRLGTSLLLAIAIMVFAGGLGQASPYWERMTGDLNNAAVYELRYEFKSPYVEIELAIPQLVGALDAKWQQEFNQMLESKIQGFAGEVREIAEEIYYGDVGTLAMPYSAFARYEVKENRGGLFSLAITYYSYTGGAHGMTFVDYINVDLTTGAEITFADLFPTETEIQRAAEVINAAIAEDPDTFFLAEFTVEHLQENQDFYLKDEQAVICFGLYELAPYVAGIQEFAVSAP